MLISTKETHKKHDMYGKLQQEIKYWENGKMRLVKCYTRKGELTREFNWDDGGKIRLEKIYEKDKSVIENKMEC